MQEVFRTEVELESTLEDRIPVRGCVCSIDWLIVYGFTSRSRIFHLYGGVTITGEALQNLGLFLALGAFEKGGIFIMPHML
jgi:hypothetical protein